MNICDKNRKVPFSNINKRMRDYIIEQVQMKQNYKTRLQEDEYNLQMEQYIKDILNIQNQNPKIVFSKIVSDYIKNL